MPDSPDTATPDGAIPDDVEGEGNGFASRNRRRPDMSSRDYLVMLLMSGAEIEHALMVQYLYAAYSINGDQPTAECRNMVEGWRASILSVAREEMGHLLTVQNVLMLLGAPINLQREMFPWDHEFYPFPFSLEPLSIKSLQCYIYAEMPPSDSLGVAAPGKQREKNYQPSSISEERQREIIKEVKDQLAHRFDRKRVHNDLHRVGELYDEIIALISNADEIPEATFDESSFAAQASWDDWGRNYGPTSRALDPDGNRDKTAEVGSSEPQPSIPWRHAHLQIERMANRAQAIKALRALSAQGEAPQLKEDDTGEPSHFERFIHIYEEFKEWTASDPAFKPTHAVPHNPTTRIDFARRRRSGASYIGADSIAAHHFAQLCDQRYRLLLAYLAHTFRLARTQPANQPSLRGMVMHRVFGEMYNLKSIAGLLVQLPLHGDNGSFKRAAPPFEMPYSLDLPQADREVWRQHHDLLVSSQHTCRKIFRLSVENPAVHDEIAQIGGDAYLRALMEIDNQTLLWIKKVIAGGT